MVQFKSVGSFQNVFPKNINYHAFPSNYSKLKINH